MTSTTFLLNSYILEGKELEFYMKKLQRKKGKDAVLLVLHKPFVYFSFLREIVLVCWNLEAFVLFSNTLLDQAAVARFVQIV